MIPLFKVSISDSAKSRVSNVLDSGMIGEGPEVEAFQKNLEQLFGNLRVLPVSSCTGSLVLALRLAGVRFGDEVISSPFTMIATNTAIKQAGAKIRWCDVDLDTYCADVSDVKKLVSEFTKAIVISCVGGVIPHDLESLVGKGVPVILDCAQGLLTTINGVHISNCSDYCAFSFQAIKHLTTGDGGALSMSCDRDFQKAKRLKWFGLTRDIPQGISRLEHQMTADVAEWGYKCHMNDISAAIGNSNISAAIQNVRISREIANFYLRELRGLPGVVLPSPPAKCDPSWWVFGILTSKRKELMLSFKKNGIESSPLWIRNDKYSAFAECHDRKLPKLARLTEEVLFIPNGWWVSRKDQEKIISIIKDVHS